MPNTLTLETTDGELSRLAEKIEALRQAINANLTLSRDNALKEYLLELLTVANDELSTTPEAGRELHPDDILQALNVLQGTIENFNTLNNQYLDLKDNLNQLNNSLRHHATQAAFNSKKVDAIILTVILTIVAVVLAASVIAGFVFFVIAAAPLMAPGAAGAVFIFGVIGLMLTGALAAALTSSIPVCLSIGISTIKNMKADIFPNERVNTKITDSTLEKMLDAGMEVIKHYQENTTTDQMRVDIEANKASKLELIDAEIEATQADVQTLEKFVHDEAETLRGNHTSLTTIHSVIASLTKKNELLVAKKEKLNDTAYTDNKMLKYQNAGRTGAVIKDPERFNSRLKEAEVITINGRGYSIFTPHSKRVTATLQDAAPRVQCK